MISRFAFILGTVLYILLTTFAYLYWVPHGFEFTGDAASYNLAAVHLLTDQFYSIDGVHAFFDREPLYSAFLAAVYTITSSENIPAIYLAQVALYYACSIVFVCVLDRFTGRRISGICFVLLLTSPSVVHALFIVYREALALPLLLLLAASVLSYAHHPKWFKAVSVGILLGLLPLVYYSFIYLPIGLGAYLIYERGKWPQILAMALIAAGISGAWGYRNQQLTGTFRIIGSMRTDVLWYVRGEQAEKVHGTEPFMCLWAEYVSRDWTHRSSACSYNGLLHTHWPLGYAVRDPAVAAAGQAKIRQHFGSYLWFSVFEILELHLPFLGGGWPFAYNLAAAIGSAVVYLGCVLGIPRIFQRKYLFLWMLVVYNTAVFALTDATPRYLIPVTFCYAVFAAVGYDRLLQAIRNRF